MQEIQQQVISNYQDNMKYFENNHPSLHNKLLALDTLLNNGNYPQKYDLEYKDGYFDVVELQTNAYLYNQDSELFSEEITQKITHKKDDQTFKSYRKMLFGDKMKDFLKVQDAYTMYTSRAEIMKYYYENTDDSMSMINIDKFIFLGSGLGMHIAKIIKKFNLQVVLIIEDNIELFRLSLFTTNYKDAFNSCIAHFSIANSPTEFHTKFNNFFLQAFFKNQYIKFNIFSSAYESKIQEIRGLLITRPEATYSHERLLVKSKRVIEKISEGYKFLNLDKKVDETFFTDKPWLVLGAGPSLNNNAEWIVENQNKFIIIAAFTSLHTLKRIGVKPDIVVQIDENDYFTDLMLNNLGDLDFLKDTIVFFSASVSKLLFDKFDKEELYLHEDRTKYKLSSTLAVSSVGDTIYTLALLYNVSHIYLLGLDLALSDDGLTHAPDHFDVKTVDTKEDEEDDDDQNFQLENNYIRVRGNFRDVVKTTPLLNLSIPVINYKTQAHKSEHQTIYNMCDGAYFENTLPLRCSEVDEKNDFDKKNIHESLKKFFDGYSSTYLHGKEIDILEQKESQIHDFYDILEKFRTMPHSNVDIFLGSYIVFVSDIINHKDKFELQELLSIYFFGVASYVDDLINTKEVTNKKKHVKKFKTFFTTHVKNILSTYEEDFKKLKESCVESE